MEKSIRTNCCKADFDVQDLGDFYTGVISRYTCDKCGEECEIAYQ